MKLSEYKKDSYEFSKLTSERVKEYSFAGIAVIWIFKLTNSSEHLIPEQLYIPLFFLILTLGFDFFQVFVPSIIWSLFFFYHEQKNSDKEIKAKRFYTYPGWIFYIFKIITLLIAYIFLLKYILKFI